MVLESGGGGDALRRKRRKGGVQGDDGRLLSERGSVECIIRNERINNTNGNSVSMMHQKEVIRSFGLSSDKTDALLLAT